MRGGNVKKILIGVVLLVAAGGATWALAARTAKSDASYRMVKIQRGDVEATVTATRNLQATKTVEVGTQVSGQIAANERPRPQHPTRWTLCPRRGRPGRPSAFRVPSR